MKRQYIQVEEVTGLLSSTQLLAGRARLMSKSESAVEAPSIIKLCHSLSALLADQQMLLDLPQHRLFQPADAVFFEHCVGDVIDSHSRGTSVRLPFGT